MMAISRIHLIRTQDHSKQFSDFGFKERKERLCLLYRSVAQIG